MTQQLEEGQIILGTVEKIVGTSVFVKIEGGHEGTITMSEIAPGRIRNLREYVEPSKKIVCKVLKIQGDRIILSLRRVKQNERKELLDKIAKENSYRAILKTVLNDQAPSTIDKITEHTPLLEFFENIEKNKKIFESYAGKEGTEKIIKILQTKKEKPKEIKQFFTFSSRADNGMVIVKNILQESIKETSCEIKYLAAGKYKIIVEGENFKNLRAQLHAVLEFIEKAAKKNKCFFEIKKD